MTAAIGEHLLTVELEDYSFIPSKLTASTITVQMDEEWIPYVQATVVCPLGDGALATVNPQSRDIWVVITATRVYGRTDRIRDISRRYRRQHVAAITAEFEDDTVAAVTASTYHDYETPGSPRRSDERTWRLMLREVVIDRSAATVTMQLASGEARLTDWDHMSPSKDRVPGVDLRDKVDYILFDAGFPEGITYAPVTTPTDAEIGDEALRTPGSSALDFLTGLTRAHGLMLWCDEAGLWHLAVDRSRPTVRKLYSAGDDRSIGNEISTRSRDDGWITAVMIIYTWDDADGKAQEAYDIYSPFVPNPEKALIKRINRPWPGAGLAEQIWRQVVGRGRGLELTAIAVLFVDPGQSVEYTSPRETVRGRLASIRWQFPDDTMSIRLREVGPA